MGPGPPGPQVSRQNRTISTAIVTDRVIDPSVAVTVTAYIPGVVRREADTVRVDEPLPPAARVREVGSAQASGKIVGSRGGTSTASIDTVRLTVPSYPFRLHNMRVEVSECPNAILREVGDASIQKSGGGGGGALSLHPVKGWSSQFSPSQKTNPWISSETVPFDTYWRRVALSQDGTLGPQLPF